MMWISELTIKLWSFFNYSYYDSKNAKVVAANCQKKCHQTAVYKPVDNLKATMPILYKQSSINCML